MSSRKCSDSSCRVIASNGTRACLRKSPMERGSLLRIHTSLTGERGGFCAAPAQACNAANSLWACGSGYYGYGPANYAVLPPAPMYTALPAYDCIRGSNLFRLPGVLRHYEYGGYYGGGGYRYGVAGVGVRRGFYGYSASWCRPHLPNRNTRRAAFVMVRCRLGRERTTPRSPMLERPCRTEPRQRRRRAKSAYLGDASEPSRHAGVNAQT